jgi:hypothetical protein
MFRGEPNLLSAILSCAGVPTNICEGNPQTSRQKAKLKDGTALEPAYSFFAVLGVAELSFSRPKSI